MPIYLTPRVYVEEVPRLLSADPQWGIDIAQDIQLGRQWAYRQPIPAFIGITAETPTADNDAFREKKAGQSTHSQPIMVKNWTDFTRLFGGFTLGAYLPDAVYGYFLNGGGPCYIVSIQAIGSPDKPDLTNPLMYQEILGSIEDRTGLDGLAAVDEIDLIICPDLFMGYDGSSEARDRIKAIQHGIISHCELMRSRFAILDTPPVLDTRQAYDWRHSSNYDSSYAALYYPWIRVPDQTDSITTSRLIPPSGHIAGVYARSDAKNGVHQNPANEVLRGVTGLELILTFGEQDVLNPIGVNALRYSIGQGVRIWGARTLSSDPKHRFVQTRRTLIYVGESIAKATEWVLFNTNTDKALWQKLKQEVADFLYLLWASGSLYGDRPEEAFTIKCDEELNSEEILDLNQLLLQCNISLLPTGDIHSFRVVYSFG